MLFSFGESLNVSCQFDLAVLGSEKLQANKFYELYLVDFDGSLRDIPVFITNSPEN